MPDHIVLTIILTGFEFIALVTIIALTIKEKRIKKKRCADYRKYRRNIKMAVNTSLYDYYANVGKNK